MFSVGIQIVSLHVIPIVTHALLLKIKDLSFEKGALTNKKKKMSEDNKFESKLILAVFECVTNVNENGTNNNNNNN